MIFLSTLTKLLHSLLICIVSTEKYAVNFMFVPLYITCHFLAGILSLSLILTNLTIVCLDIVTLCFLCSGLIELWGSLG